MSKETARLFLDAWEFFDKNPNEGFWEGLPGISRTEFFLLVSSVTGEEDLGLAKNYLEKTASGVISETVPQKIVEEVRTGKAPEGKILQTQKEINLIESWIRNLKKQPKTQEEKDETVAQATLVKTQLIEKVPEETPSVSTRPLGPTSGTLPVSAPGFSVAVEKRKTSKLSTPLSIQTAVRRLSFAPFNFLVHNSATAIAEKDPEKATVLTLVSKGITPSKLAPLKTQALASGLSSSQFDKLIQSMANLPTGTITRTLSGFATYSDLADFYYKSYQLSITPTQIGQIFLTSSKNGGSLVMPHYSFVGGIFDQIGTRLFGRTTTAILGKLLGTGAGEAVGTGVAAGATGAAAAGAGAAGGVAAGAAGAAGGAATGAGIGAIGGPVGALVGAAVATVGSKLIVYFQRNKEKIVGFFLLGAGGIAAALGFGLGGLVLMGAGGLALLGSAVGGMSGAGTQVASFGGSLLYGITHVVVPSIAAPLIISFVTIPILVAFVFFIINNSAFVMPPSAGGGVPGGGIIPPGGVIPPIPGGCKVPTSGLCSLNDPKTNLQNTFGSQVSNAAQICLAESGGVEYRINDGCLQNPLYNRHSWSAEYSVGLFQINLIVHPNPAFLNTTAGQSLKNIVSKYGVSSCYEAFSNYKDVKPSSYVFCQIGNQSLLDECVSWFQDPTNNVVYANFLSGSGNNWGPWSTAHACGIVK